MTPERILDYYPDAPRRWGVRAGSGDLVPGRGGRLDARAARRVDRRLPRRPRHHRGRSRAPYTPEGIRDAVTFTMVEDWAIVADGRRHDAHEDLAGHPAGGERRHRWRRSCDDAAKHESGARGGVERGCELTHQSLVRGAGRRVRSRGRARRRRTRARGRAARPRRSVRAPRCRGELADRERALVAEAALAQPIELVGRGVLGAVDDAQVLAARGT